MATFTWSLQAVDLYPVKPADGDPYLLTASWRCFGSQVNGGKAYSAYVLGKSGFDVVPGPGYIPPSSLNNDVILDMIWADGALKPSVEAEVQQEINDRIAPPIPAPPLPVVPPTVTIATSS